MVGRRSRANEAKHRMTAEHWNSLVPELTVRDLEKSLGFYRRAGFHVRFQRDQPPFAVIELGHAQIMLEEEHAHGWNVEPLDRPLGRGINLQIEVEDAQRAFAAFAASGDTVFRELKDAWYRVSHDHEEGRREFLVQDPDGYLLRFSQRLGLRGSMPPIPEPPARTLFSWGVVLCLLASAFFFWVWYERYLSIDFNEIGRYYDAESQVVYTDAAMAWCLPALAFLLLAVGKLAVRLWRRWKAKPTVPTVGG